MAKTDSTTHSQSDSKIDLQSDSKIDLRIQSIVDPKIDSAVNKPGEPDYYFENGFMVFTRAYHEKRGFCCGNGCRHCPFTPKHRKGTRDILPLSH